MKTDIIMYILYYSFMGNLAYCELYKELDGNQKICESLTSERAE